MASKNSDKVLPPSYVNFPLSLELPASATTDYQADRERYVNLAPAYTSITPAAPRSRTLKERQSLTNSEPALLPQPNGFRGSPSRQGQQQSKSDVLNAKFKHADGHKECSRCCELEQLLALWELGVSGLTRNYSKILAQLNKTRDAALSLESRIRQQAHHTSPEQQASPQRTSSTLGTPTRAKVRSSMYDPNTANPSETLADQMYPQSLEESLSNWHSLPQNYAKHIADLNTHLGEAIDLCQQLAASCFKSHYPRDPQSLPDIARRGSQPLLAQQSAPSFTPKLQSIAEDFPSVSKRKLTRQLSAPSSLTDSTEVVGSDGEGEGGGGTLKRVNSDTASRQDRTEGHSVVSTESFSGVMSLMVGEEEHKEAAAMNGDANGSFDEDDREGLDFSVDSLLSRGSVLSRSSTFSDSDVKQVMSKIAGLEQERVKLLETVDELQISNQQVRQSLIETLGDLENKDLQLTLAMQDLSIATDEIKMAASMRRQMKSLSVERESLLYRLNDLEDESAAVKVSLIQLLQEKSATNKTLALENWRLYQRMRASSLRRGSGGGRLGSVSSHGGGGGVGGDGDNVSMNSQFSSADDVAVQEAVMQLDDPGNFVHKQGFLTKQGARVKTWKRRLFVLDSQGLSYFKTEQPIQTLALSSICEVQVCHGRTPLPHMFELHTPGRIFYLSAQSQDDMQSWVGMLQTLKQYHKSRQPRSIAPHVASQTVKQPPAAATASSGTPQPRPVSDPSLDATLKSPLMPLNEEGEEEEEDGEAMAKSVPASSSSLFSEEEEEAVLTNPQLMINCAKVGTL